MATVSLSNAGNMSKFDAKTMADEKAENLKVGRLLGHYRLIKQIGAGGMGEVYLAEDTSLDRKVAIKFLKDKFSRDADKLNRFVQEAKAVSALNHPNILTVFEIGKIENKNYIATEFIEGKTLRNLISPHEPMQLRNILKIGIQVSEALSAAHQAGIVHRDIKPENIMIRADGYAKILDFGLAKLTERKDSENVSSESETKALVDTIPGMIMGTVSYMSPEQARGKPTDARTDIWSFGVTLFEMLANKLPFQGETINHTIVAILEKDPLLPENIPAELQRIVRKTLSKDREMRYQSAKDLMIDLKNLRRSLDIQGELERSAIPNSEAATDELHDQATVGYLEQPIEQTKESDRKARTTVRINTDGRSNYWKAAVLVCAVALIASAAWWLAGGITKDQSSTGLLKSVGITSWSSGPNELIIEAAFSPDAKMVAFGSARSGAAEIWVKPTVGGEPIQVTKNGFYNQYPIWSADGQEIAYFSKRGNKGGIWRVSFTGGEQREIVGDIDFAAKPRYWAKSGKIYFQQRSDIFAVDVKSGEIKQITDFESKGLKPRAIEVSADESKITFSIKENDVFKIKVGQFDSGQFDEIAASKNQIDYLAWHPNGKNVLFSATFEGTYHIFQTSLNGGEPIQLSTGDADFFVEDISDEGNHILYWSQNESSDLWSVNAKDGRETLLADGTESEYWAAVSPDGKSAAYQSVAKTNRPFSGSISAKNISVAGNPLTVAANGFSPVWSKNGEWIVFFKRAEKDMEIWRVGPGGGDAQKLTSDGVQSPSYVSTPYLKIGTNQLICPPDGDAVAYAAVRNGVSNIWRTTLDGQRNEPITDNKDQAEQLCCPAWTPDGKYLVVSSVHTSTESTRPTTNRLWLYAADQSSKKMLFESKEQIRFLGITNNGKDAVAAIIPNSTVSTPTPDSIRTKLVSLETGVSSDVNNLSKAYSHNIHLSPDGKLIAFVSRTDNVSEIWTIPVSGGVPQKLLAENDPKVFISNLSWSKDGKSIVFGKQTQNSLLSMLIK